MSPFRRNNGIWGNDEGLIWIFRNLLEACRGPFLIIGPIQKKHVPLLDKMHPSQCSEPGEQSNHSVTASRIHKLELYKNVVPRE